MPTPTIIYRINLVLSQADYDRLTALMASWETGQAATIRRALELATNWEHIDSGRLATKDGSVPPSAALGAPVK